MCLIFLPAGNPDFAARYKERLYYFSSEEAKASFTADPWKYTVGQEGPLKVGGCGTQSHVHVHVPVSTGSHVTFCRHIPVFDTLFPVL